MSNEPTKQELLEQAQAADIEGRSSMTKEELADALAANEGSTAEMVDGSTDVIVNPHTPLAGISPVPAEGGYPAEPTRALGQVGANQHSV